MLMPLIHCNHHEVDDDDCLIVDDWLASGVGFFCQQRLWLLALARLLFHDMVIIVIKENEHSDFKTLLCCSSSLIVM